jgi:hypothetical protein
MTHGLHVILSRLRNVFVIEPLPRDPPHPRRRSPGAWRRLFAPEPLARDPEVPRPRRARWLAWLFAPERLDPP